MLIDVRMPTPRFITSIDALVAVSTSGNWTTATLVGSRGASLIVTKHTTMPNVNINSENGHFKQRRRKRTLGNDAQCALGSDEQLGRVKARR